MKYNYDDYTKLEEPTVDDLIEFLQGFKEQKGGDLKVFFTDPRSPRTSLTDKVLYWSTAKPKGEHDPSKSLQEQEWITGGLVLQSLGYNEDVPDMLRRK